MLIPKVRGCLRKIIKVVVIIINDISEGSLLKNINFGD